VLILGDFEAHFLNDKTIRTFDLHEYPPVDPASIAKSQRLVSAALTHVSEESKAQAYQAHLGYYKGSMRDLKWKTEHLVQNANDFARYCLQTAPQSNGTWVPPALQAKTVGKMGLKDAAGLNVQRGQSQGGRQQSAPSSAKRQQSQQMQRETQPPAPHSDAPRRGGGGRARGGSRGRGGRGGAPASARAPPSDQYGGW
jgi:ATP-dependent RNA helicase MSS116